MNIVQAIEALRTHGQEDVAARMEKLAPEAQERMVAQVAQIDWKMIADIQNHQKAEEVEKKVEPLSAVERKDIEANKESYISTGVKAIQEGKVAAVLLAGGQGTRLGLDMPKGTLNIGEHKDLYLFEQLVYNLLDVVKQTGAYIPLYIMTSEKNNDDTVAFFKEHQYFGYDASFVTFFVQNMAPSVDYDGKLYMESEDSLAMSPNGNGGWFLSMISAVRSR